MAEITVYPATLRWAVKTSNADPAAVAARRGLADFPEWLSSSEPLRLSFSKLSDIGKALQMPFGSLVRSSVPEQHEDELVQYRTIKNHGVEPSRDLRDVIRLMRNRQDWAKDELSARGLDENQLVGSVASDISAEELGKAIREKLQLDDAWYARKTVEEQFRYIRQRASENGLIVMVDSKVGTSHRRLSVQEFRAFVLLDPTAPLIFINRNDSYSAMLFSLLHEIGHVLLGSNEIFNDDFAMGETRVERLINRAVVQSVVDNQDFCSYWKESSRRSNNILMIANECARRYGLSALALTIHARYLGLAADEDVQTVSEEMRERLSKTRSSDAKGGNQNNTNAFHLDSGFVGLVKSSIDRGSLSYSDGFSLLGVKSIQAYDGLLQVKGMANE